MNIVIVTPSWPQDGNPNGIVTYYTNLVPALIELGHQVDIITYRSSDKSENVHVAGYTLSFIERVWCRIRECVDPGYRQYLTSTKAIACALERVNKKHSIDVMQMEDSFGWHHAINQFVTKKFSFPVVMRLHGPYFLNAFEKIVTKQTQWRMRREKKAFLAAKYITSPSFNVLKKTQSLYGDSWLVADAISNAMPISDIKDQWSIESIASQQILFVGRFDNHKGGDVMLHAFFKVKTLLPSATLIFIGPDKGLDDNGCKIHVEQFLEKYGYTEMYGQSHGIEFLGKQDKKTINKFRQCANVTVVASRYETFGNVALEAMACGSPLICSDSGALIEIVEDGVSGLLFESENSEALANTIMQVMQSDQLAKKLSCGGLERAQSVFSPLASANLTIASFSKAIQLHRDK
jgi:glycosyltransferase involved in cell wall biosynthesis